MFVKKFRTRILVTSREGAAVSASITARHGPTAARDAAVQQGEAPRMETTKRWEERQVRIPGTGADFGRKD